jgi:hypothetical protein
MILNIYFSGDISAALAMSVTVATVACFGLECIMRLHFS